MIAAKALKIFAIASTTVRRASSSPRSPGGPVR